MSDTLTKGDVETRPEMIYREPGDHERLSHFYDRRIYDATQAAVEGKPIPMLCGRVLVPSRDPKFPVCPECQAIVDYRSRD